MEIWIYLIGMAALLLLGLATAAVLYHLCRQSLFAQHRLQADTNVIVAELLAHRTLAETGNVTLAGQMLAHSNAHGMRTELPQLFTPPGPEREELQSHESNPVQIGVEDDFGLAAPAEG